MDGQSTSTPEAEGAPSIAAATKTRTYLAIPWWALVVIPLAFTLVMVIEFRGELIYRIEAIIRALVMLTSINALAGLAWRGRGPRSAIAAALVLSIFIASFCFANWGGVFDFTIGNVYIAGGWFNVVVLPLASIGLVSAFFAGDRRFGQTSLPLRRVLSASSVGFVLGGGVLLGLLDLHGMSFATEIYSVALAGIALLGGVRIARRIPLTPSPSPDSRLRPRPNRSPLP